MMNAHRITPTLGAAACGLLVVGAIVGAGLLVVPSVAPSPRTVQVRAIQLVDTADSPLGDGTALVFGGTGVPIPPPNSWMPRTRCICSSSASPAPPNLPELFSLVFGLGQLALLGPLACMFSDSLS